MPDILQDVLAALGTLLVTSGGSAVAAFALFKWLGERWITAKFQERLQSYKHAQQQELEQLRYQINALMDRATKLHQREFDVLPEAWARLIDAHAQITWFTSPVQSYPDLDRMHDGQIDDFLRESPLSEYEKQELKLSSKKTSYYSKTVFWHRLNNSRRVWREYKLYIRKNSLLIPASLRDKFNRVADILHDALVESEMNHDLDPGMRRTRTALEALSGDGAKLIEAIETEAHSQLWNLRLEKSPPKPS